MTANSTAIKLAKRIGLRFSKSKRAKVGANETSFPTPGASLRLGENSFKPSGTNKIENNQLSMVPIAENAPNTRIVSILLMDKDEKPTAVVNAVKVSGTNTSSMASRMAEVLSCPKPTSRS